MKGKEVFMWQRASSGGGSGGEATMICDLVGTSSGGSYDSSYVTPARTSTYLQVTFLKDCSGVISCKGATTASGTCSYDKQNGSTTGCNDFYTFSASAGQTFRTTVSSATQYQRLTVII